LKNCQKWKESRNQPLRRSQPFEASNAECETSADRRNPIRLNPKRPRERKPSQLRKRATPEKPSEADRLISKYQSIFASALAQLTSKMTKQQTMGVI
jgi:hypothetical protein